MNYTMLGCGSSEYENTYNNFAKEANKFLQERNGNLIGEFGLIDASNLPEQSFIKWKKVILSEIINK